MPKAPETSDTSSVSLFYHERFASRSTEIEITYLAPDPSGIYVTIRPCGIDAEDIVSYVLGVKTTIFASPSAVFDPGEFQRIVRLLEEALPALGRSYESDRPTAIAEIYRLLGTKAVRPPVFDQAPYVAPDRPVQVRERPSGKTKKAPRKATRKTTRRAGKKLKASPVAKQSTRKSKAR